MLTHEREVAGGDHAGEAVEELDVDLLELTRLAPDLRRRLAREDREDVTLEAHGNALDARPFADVGGDLAVDDLAQLEGLGDEVPLGGRDDASHLVLVVQGLARGGADLAEHDEPLLPVVAVVGLEGREQQQVGEGNVGEQGPRGHQPLQVLEGRTGQAGVGGRQRGKRDHVVA